MENIHFALNDIYSHQQNLPYFTVGSSKYI